MDYIRHFNQQAAHYLQFRPAYPDVLYQFLASLVKTKNRVWDVATGNGQAAQGLVKYFSAIFATDVNFSPLQVAPKHPAIHYLCCTAEQTPIKDHSMHLISIAQALHWFAHDSFYQEVRRVAHSEAIIAAWCYSLGRLTPAIDKCVDRLYYEILDAYWPKERQWIDEEYKTIPFPFKSIPSPSFFIEKKINFEQLVGYLLTWSAVKEYEKQNQSNPLMLCIDELRGAWGKAETEYVMRWPLHLRAARV